MSSRHTLTLFNSRSDRLNSGPIVYTDDYFNRPDGPLDSNWIYTSGWEIVSGAATSQPRLGTTLIVSGDMETDDLSGLWITSRSGSVTVSSNEHTGGDGTRSLCLSNNGSDYGLASHTLSNDPVVGDWYELDFWAVSASGSIGHRASLTNSGVDGYFTAVSSWTSRVATGLKTYPGNSVTIVNGSNVLGNASLFDDIQLRPITTSDLFAVQRCSTDNPYVYTSLSVKQFTQAGIVICLDDPTNPRNFVVGYHDGIYAGLMKCVNGIYTSLISVAANYVDRAYLKLIKNKSQVSLYYNNIQIGDTQIVSDVGILNNTYHGLFNTHPDNHFHVVSISDVLHPSIEWPGHGPIVYVTNLEDDGPGSLRDAVESGVAETVKFLVCGNITLKTEINIRKAHLTVDGHDAPGKGICITGAQNFNVDADSIHLTYLRFRPGPPTDFREVDGISVTANGTNLRISHCSASWSNDEILRLYGLGAIVEWCIFSEALELDHHPKGTPEAPVEHSYAVSLSAQTKFDHNLIASSLFRCPKVTVPVGQWVGITNCVIYNCYYMLLFVSDNGPAYYDVIGNYFIEGPEHQTPGRWEIESWDESAISYLYLEDNLGPHREDGDPEINVVYTWNQDKFNYLSEPHHSKPSGLTRASQALIDVLASAGCSLPERDDVDIRIVNDVINRTGARIDDPSEVGGWASLCV